MITVVADTMMDEGLQPVVDHDVSLTCPKCDHEFEEEISILGTHECEKSLPVTREMCADGLPLLCKECGNNMEHYEVIHRMVL